MIEENKRIDSLEAMKENYKDIMLTLAKKSNADTEVIKENTNPRFTTLERLKDNQGSAEDILGAPLDNEHAEEVGFFYAPRLDAVGLHEDRLGESDYAAGLPEYGEEIMHWLHMKHLDHFFKPDEIAEMWQGRPEFYTEYEFVGALGREVVADELGEDTWEMPVHEVYSRNLPDPPEQIRDLLMTVDERKAMQKGFYHIQRHVSDVAGHRAAGDKYEEASQDQDILRKNPKQIREDYVLDKYEINVIADALG